MNLMKIFRKKRREHRFAGQTEMFGLIGRIAPCKMVPGSTLAKKPKSPLFFSFIRQRNFFILFFRF